MADDPTVPTGQVPTGTDPTPQTPPSNPPNDPPGQDPDEEFDKERALNTIRKLRGFEKTANQLQQRLAEYERREQEAEREKMSELQRLQDDVKRRDTELQTERQTSRDLINRYEVQLAASKLGIVDPEAAVKLLDWSQLEYGNDGRPKDVDGALTDLLTERPWLKAPAAATQQTTPVNPTNPSTRQTPPGQKRYTQAQLADRDFYVANREDIQRAFREGRIDP